MARYYFDVFDGDHVTLDEVGIDLPGTEEVEKHAVEALPEIASDELPNGPQRDFWVRAHNGDGDHFFAADLKFRADWLKRRG
ncbi:DUF6894 family protein [Mesorhizobium sp. IMUNJ 23232]|uniref:DUF6894 family protein n=1 Tax=Mesorhizobium sp. IMUNJ 23232 TaxID=3376064 RepID=UPI0037B669D6